MTKKTYGGLPEHTVSGKKTPVMVGNGRVSLPNVQAESAKYSKKRK